MRGEFPFGVDPKDAMFFAGHSLGEYSALCAAGALSLSETAKLLRIRGEAMQKAVPVGKGAMAALIGVDIEGGDAGVQGAQSLHQCPTDSLVPEEHAGGSF